MEKRFRILVVDDNRDLAENIRDILIDKGYDAAMAYNGKGAVERCLQAPFDLVLVDYKLPDMDGLELFDRLSEIMTSDYLIITAHASIESAAEAVRRRRIIGYETKPLDMNRLTAFIAQIVHRRRAEDIVTEQSFHMQLAQKMARLGYWRFDVATGAPSWSAMMYTILGCDPAQGVPSFEEHRRFVHPDDWEMFSRRVREAADGKPFDIELRIIFPDESLHYVAAQGYPQYDADGKITHLFGVTQDITERKRTEERLKTALTEKDTLLQELFHRTKNNMQVIISMLSLRSMYTPDEKLKEITKELENKIHVMALVHQKLYQAGDLSRVDLREYISDLTDLLLQSYAEKSPAVSPRLDVVSAPILIDAAIPCGLILNELISNSLKHAFPRSEKDEIQIKMTRTDDRRIEMFYADNGPGVPDGFDFRGQRTLGLQTAIMIAEHQLQGSIEFDGKSGVSCRLRFEESYFDREG